GQTEQEYLGRYLMERSIALYIKQKDFSLNNALTAAAAFTYTMPAIATNERLTRAVEDLLSTL
ncbi:MAG: hypothetical protein ABI688_10160, partial [Bacteroidota bacterium]